MSLNQEIADLFGQMAALMELKGENVFKVIAFQKVGRIIRDSNMDVQKCVVEGYGCAGGGLAAGVQGDYGDHAGGDSREFATAQGDGGGCGHRQRDNGSGAGDSDHGGVCETQGDYSGGGDRAYENEREDCQRDAGGFAGGAGGELRGGAALLHGVEGT